MGCLISREPFTYYGFQPGEYYHFKITCIFPLLEEARCSFQRKFFLFILSIYGMGIFNNLRKLLVIDSQLVQTFYFSAKCDAYQFPLNLSCYISAVLQGSLKNIINYNQCCLKVLFRFVYETSSELLQSIKHKEE